MPAATVRIDVVLDTARPQISALQDLIKGPLGKEAIGRGVRNRIVKHLRALPPNKEFPEATTGYYQTAAESVTAPAITGDQVVVSITQTGFRQRLQGGMIVPKEGKYLTEAAQAATYGHRAGEFSGVKFAFAEDEDGTMRPALVADDGGAGLTGAKRKKGVRKQPIEAESVLFWLIRSANQEADPDVLPTSEELAQSAASAMQSLLRASLHDPTAKVSIADITEDLS